MGYGVLDIVDYADVQQQLQPYFDDLKTVDPLGTTTIFTSSGTYELSDSEAYNLLESIKAGTNYVPFSWYWADVDGAKNASLDTIAHYLNGLYETGSFQPVKTVERMIDIVTTNLEMSAEERTLISSFISASSYLALDYYGSVYQHSGNQSFLNHEQLYFGALVAIDAIIGLRRVDKKEVLETYKRENGHLPLERFGSRDTRLAWKAALMGVAKGLNGKPDFSERERFAFDVFSSAFELESYEPNLERIGAIGRYNGLPLPEIAISMLYGIYYYLEDYYSVNEQVIYVNLDEFYLVNIPPVLKGMSDKGFIEDAIKDGVQQVLHGTYKDLPEIKIVFERPATGTYHTLSIFTSLDKLLTYLKTHPISIRECMRAVGTLEKLSFSVDGEPYYVLPIVKSRYHVADNESICDSKHIQKISSEPIVAYHSVMEGSRGCGDFNVGNRKRAQDAYVHSLVSKTGLTFNLPFRQNPNETYLAMSYTHPPASYMVEFKKEHGNEEFLSGLALYVGLTTAHEIGHLFGLYHDSTFRSSSSRSLMNDKDRPFTTTEAALSDKNKTYLKFILTR